MCWLTLFQQSTGLADTNTSPTNLVGNVVGIGSFIPTTSLVGNVVGNATFPTKIGPVPTKYFVGSKENSCSEPS
jgi:hypothetical protein